MGGEGGSGSRSIESSSLSIWHAAYMLASKSDPRPFQTALIIQMLYFFISKLKFVRQSICEDLLKQQALVYDTIWQLHGKWLKTDYEILISSLLLKSYKSF